jgi:hypothetical protein
VESGLQFCEVMPVSKLSVLNCYILSMHISDTIHTVNCQSTERLHITTALILPGVLFHYQSIFRETHYSIKLLVVYISTWNIGF